MFHVKGPSALIKPLCTVLVSASLLSACVVAIGGDGDDDWEYSNHKHRRGSDSHLNVRLVDGERASFHCPDDYRVFAEEDADGVTRYGCELDDDG